MGGREAEVVEHRGRGILVEDDKVPLRRPAAGVAAEGALICSSILL
jgi:hypothetical protein